MGILLLGAGGVRLESGQRLLSPDCRCSWLARDSSTVSPMSGIRVALLVQRRAGMSARSVSRKAEERTTDLPTRQAWAPVRAVPRARIMRPLIGSGLVRGADHRPFSIGRQHASNMERPGYARLSDLSREPLDGLSSHSVDLLHSGRYRLPANPTHRTSASNSRADGPGKFLPLSSAGSLGRRQVALGHAAAEARSKRASYLRSRSASLGAFFRVRDTPKRRSPASESVVAWAQSRSTSPR